VGRVLLPRDAVALYWDARRKAGPFPARAGDQVEIVEVVEVVVMKKHRTSLFVATAVSAALLMSSADARAADTKAAGNDFGVGMLTVLANVVYMPVKVTYGLLGGLTGGFAYVLSGANREVADGVWVPSLGGDYVLTTDMMTGGDAVHFNGVRGRTTTSVAAADEDGRLADETLGSSNF